MQTVSVSGRPGLQRVASWRIKARRLLQENIPPQQVLWHDEGEPTLPLHITDEGPAAEVQALPLRLSRNSWALLQRIGCHSSLGRYAEMYEAIWRLAHGEPQLWELHHDPLVQALTKKDAAVRREMHKTKAFVRFALQTPDQSQPIYVAWFEPDHDALELVVPFFEGRFAQMHWAILTPRLCVRWDGKHAHYSPGIVKPDTSASDSCSAAWQTYYRHVFNPARLRTRAMIREMPVRYWKNLPEATLIPELVREAGVRTSAMLAQTHEERPALAATAKLTDTDAVSDNLDNCRLCPHARFATQAVAGEGPLDARIMLVGEQPGDQEDLAGRPFVGPAGHVLDDALVAAGLERSQLFLTNAVKHFQWQLRGKRRLHKTPGQREILACRGFLLQELAIVNPTVIVALGSTAAFALLHGTGLSSRAGELLILPNGIRLMPTLHPAYILRQKDQAHLHFQQLVDALIAAAGCLDGHSVAAATEQQPPPRP